LRRGGRRAGGRRRARGDRGGARRGAARRGGGGRDARAGRAARRPARPRRAQGGGAARAGAGLQRRRRPSRRGVVRGARRGAVRADQPGEDGVEPGARARLRRRRGLPPLLPPRLPHRPSLHDPHRPRARRDGRARRAARSGRLPRRRRARGRARRGGAARRAMASLGPCMTDPDLSIVLLTWNGRELALACLASIERTVRAPGAPLAVETIVVDNGSRDGTVEAVRARFPWAEVVALPHNVGFAAGNNAGLARARGRHVALLNNDTEVLPGCFEACVRFLDAHPGVGVVGPQLLHPDGRLQNSIHNAPTLLAELVPRGVLETLFPRRFPSKRYRHDGPIDVEAVLGACMVVRREALAAVGPLPEDYFFFLEETDWLYAMRAAGWRVVHLPEA